MARTVSAGLAEGYDVTRISPDASSVQNVAELQPDLVILDAPSEGQDAASLCNELRQSEGTSRIQMLLLQGVFDSGSCPELPGFAPETKLFKPFVADGLRDKVESVIKAATEDRKRIAAPAPEERVAPVPITISDDELDRALSEALKELKAESPAQEVGKSDLDDMELSLDALEIEPEVIDDNQLDEGVGREESAELMVGEVKTTADENELMEAKALTEDIGSIGKGMMGDREFMDEMIDGLVDRAMERFSLELKASLKRSLNEKMRQMARRAVQELLPKLSERLIAEMFKSESEKQQ